MGRWFCSVVLHDCRLAPITDIAKGSRRAKAKQGVDDTIIKLTASQSKIREAVDSMSTGILAEVGSLSLARSSSARSSRDEVEDKPGGSPTVAKKFKQGGKM